MALDIVQYKSGDPITAGTTYQIPGEMNSEAWILQSTTQGAVFQMTATAPTDEDWSNIQDTQFHINGTVTGLILPILSNGYFRVVKEPVTEHATMALVEQEFQMEVADPINPFVAGTPVAPGYYDLSSLNLEAGKMYVLSVLPEQDKEYPETPGIVTDETFSAVIVGLTGTKATQVILRGVTTVGSHLFVMTGAKPILHLGGRSNVKFNITVSHVVFSAGSGGSLTPSSDANITGAWSFTNITVPTPTQAGQAANKSYVDNAVSGIGANFVTLDTEQTISGNKTFTGRVMKTGSPLAPSDLTNKLYVDGQIAPTVKNVGNQNVAGVKTFTDGVTMADEAPLTFGVGADAVKFHGTGAGMSVIEGGTGAHLDVAVSTTFQEPTVFQDATTFSTMIKAEKGISFGITSGSSAMETLMEQNHPTLPSYGCKWTYTANNGYYQLVQRNNIVWLTFDPTGNVWFRKKFEVQGPATFTQGVTMGQTLSVAGKASFGDGIESNKPIVLMDGVGVLSGSIEGYYGDPSNSGFSFIDSTSTVFFRLNYNNAAKRVEVSLPTADSSLVLPVMESVSVSGTCQAEVFQFGPNSIRYNASTPTTVEVSGDWKFGITTFTGAAAFNAGVTMGQTLTVTGAINSNGLLNIADGTGIQFGTSINMYSSGADFWLEGPANGKVGLNLPIEFPGPAEGTTLTDNMGVNVAMGDARYAKIVTTTKAAYTALATKDPTTIYLITDTTPRMWAIGDMGIVTAAVPA